MIKILTLKPLNMALAIGATSPGGNTSIGDGLLTAATEEDAEGDDDHFCVIALLSDGYENVEPFWDDVAADVTDNEPDSPSSENSDDD